MNSKESSQAVAKGQDLKPGPEDPQRQDFDLSLLEESLAKTPLERMQANDDALNFADMLSGAMENLNAKLNRADPQTY